MVRLLPKEEKFFDYFDSASEKMIRGVRLLKEMMQDLSDVEEKAKQIKEYIVSQYESYFHAHKEEQHEEQHQVVVTSPKAMDVVITQSYVCQIHSKQHIEVRALDSGYLQEIAGHRPSDGR